MLKDFFSLLFPRYCLSCDGPLASEEETLCTTCIYELPKTNYHLEPENPVMGKFYGLIRIKHAFAYLKFVKNGKVQKLMHQLKYGNHPEIALLLGRWFGQELKDQYFHQEFDLIVPIPLHRSRLRQRGYNQSDPFAQGLSESLGIPWDAEVLQRVIKSQTQTLKGREERWRNVSNIFEINKPNQVQGKKLLLVDDVITTGSTLESCGNTLYQGDCLELSVCTIAVSQ